MCQRRAFLQGGNCPRYMLHLRLILPRSWHFCFKISLCSLSILVWWGSWYILHVKFPMEAPISGQTSQQSPSFDNSSCRYTGYELYSFYLFNVFQCTHAVTLCEWMKRHKRKTYLLAIFCCKLRYVDQLPVVARTMQLLENATSGEIKHSYLIM